MSNIGSYEDRLKNFSWSIAERELEYAPGGVLNIGWHCSDLICLQGHGAKTALRWEGMNGVEKKFTYDDIRRAGNTIGAFLRGLGIREGERVHR